MELFCCRSSGRFALSFGDGVAGLLLAFWYRIWTRRSFSQMRSSTKFLFFDGVFLAGRKTVFLLLLRCLCQRSSGGWFVVFVGVECVGVWVCETDIERIRCDLRRAMDSQLPPPPQSSPPAPTTTILTIGDDLLLEIFVRLPSLPSLVRAAFACRTFLHAVRSFPTFRPRFRALHPPPLIGLFVRNRDGDIPSFVPLRGRADLDHAAVVRGSDFFLTRLPDDQGLWNITDCRDGYLLLHNWEKRLFAAYNPLAGVLHRIPSPPAAVRELYILSSPEERHGSFRLVCIHEDGLQVRPVVFSSDTGEWQVSPWTEAATINKDHPDDYKHCLPATSGKLVNGRRIYWTIRNYMTVFDIATLQFSSMPLPPITEGQKPFVVGETKDVELCMVCAIDDRLMVAVWVWKADAEKWMLDKEIILDDIPALNLVAVKQGFLHLHLMADDEPGIVPLCWFFSFCLETKELKKIFSLYEYELEWSHPYIMPWPSSLVCNKVNPRIEGA